MSTARRKTAIIGDWFGDPPAGVFDDLSAKGISAEYQECRDDADIVALAGDADFVWLVGSGPVFTAARPTDCPAAARSSARAAAPITSP